MFKRRTFFGLCIALMILCLTACSGKQEKENKENSGKIKVSVTFNAMKEFTQAVAGDKAEIVTIIPDGTEPHDFEPKAQDLTSLSNASVFIYNGLGMETWVENAITAADNKNLVVVEASKGSEVITNTGETEKNEHGQYDPHLWLSIKGAETEVTNIKDGFIKTDPNNREFYEKNCSDYIAKLEELYKKYSDKLSTATKRSFVTGHAAFAYLCRDFDLGQNSVEDVFAEGEPSAKQLTELVKYCKDNKVSTVFAEKMTSPEVSQTLADEVGAKVVTIYTVESEEDGKTYIERMEYNLDKIYSSLTR